MGILRGKVGAFYLNFILPHQLPHSALRLYWQVEHHPHLRGRQGEEGGAGGGEWDCPVLHGLPGLQTLAGADHQVTEQQVQAVRQDHTRH